MSERIAEPDGGPGQRTDAQLQLVQHLARVLLERIRDIPLDDLRAALSRFERSETMAPFIDPTFYLRNQRDISAFARDFRKFVELREYLEARR